MSLNLKDLTPPSFKNEKELQKHLAENLHLIEPGLTLYEEKDFTGIEVPCRITDWGRQGSIDILALDKDGNYVVIECKHKYGDGMAFGQLLGYMSWVKRRLGPARGRKKAAHVRGIIVAKRANPLLRLLLTDYPQFDITVYEFECGASLRLLSPGG